MKTEEIKDINDNKSTITLYQFFKLWRDTPFTYEEKVKIYNRLFRGSNND